MKGRGKLVNVTRNIRNNRLLITIEAAVEADKVLGLSDKELTVELKEYNPKRSLTSNAYYWELIGQLSAATGEPSSWLHNKMLREYGTRKVISGCLIMAIIPDTEEAEKMVLCDEKNHLSPTSNVKKGSDGKNYRWYVQLKGSSEMDQAEFGRLIDGLIDECQAVGIDTMTKDEVAQLRWLSES